MDRTAKVTVNVGQRVFAEGSKFVVEWRELTFLVNVDQADVIKQIAFNPEIFTKEFEAKGMLDRLEFRKLAPLDLTTS